MESKRVFKHIDLNLIKPEWGSRLSLVVFELEQLRTKQLYSPTVPPYIFFQLKEIFHLLESVGSVRIEGNRTTISEFVEKVIEGRARADESSKEIDNINNALKFIHENVRPDTTISRAILSEIHKIITKDLTPPPGGEGSLRPGELRNIRPAIKNSPLVLPEHIQVPDYIDELITFINQKTDKNNDLLITALSHHRFAWIHPYDNGNGRLVRLLTYMMLVKQGFQVKEGSILNPAAIFCMDRQEYYDKLSIADTGEDIKLIEWCEYVLIGLKGEIEKIDKLLDKEFLVNKILLPVFNISLDNKLIDEQEFKILKHVVNSPEMKIKSKDLTTILNEGRNVQRSRVINKLKLKKMITPLSKQGRIYTVNFSNNYLLRGIIEILSKEGFVSNLDQKTVVGF